MSKQKVFGLIKAAVFFRIYCPGIVDWRRKVYGRKGAEHQPDFSPAERERINKALERIKFKV